MDYCFAYCKPCADLSDEELIVCSDSGYLCDECPFCVSSNSVR